MTPYCTGGKDVFDFLQMKRVMTRLESLREPLEQYVHLMGLQERNERLFYRVLSEEIEQLLPIVYTPTVSRACAQYGLIYSRPRGLYITVQDRGKVGRFEKKNNNNNGGGV